MPVFSTIALFCTVLGLTLAGAPAGHAHELETVKLVFQRAIPNIPGKNLVALVVNYPPGGKSPPHRHAKSAFIYAHVLTGAIRSVVGTEPAKVYQAGEGFHEEPGAHHRVSENASDTQPAVSGGLHRRCRGPATHHTGLEFRHTIVPCRADLVALVEPPRWLCETTERKECRD